MAPHSSTLAWRIPWTEEPGRLQSMGSRRVRHDWVTSLSLFTFMHWRRKWQPTPVFLPGESQGQWSLVGCHLWVAQSQTRLKQLSSSSSSRLYLCKLISGPFVPLTYLPLLSPIPHCLDYCSFIVKSQSWIVSAPTLFFSLKIAYILDLYIFFKLGLYFCDPLIFISRLNFFAYSENLSIQLLLDLLIWICLVAQSCPILYNPVDCSLPGSSVHRIL